MGAVGVHNPNESCYVFCGRVPFACLNLFDSIFTVCFLREMVLMVFGWHSPAAQVQSQCPKHSAVKSPQEQVGQFNAVDRFSAVPPVDLWPVCGGVIRDPAWFFSTSFSASQEAGTAPTISAFLLHRTACSLQFTSLSILLPEDRLSVAFLTTNSYPW